MLYSSHNAIHEDGNCLSARGILLRWAYRLRRHLFFSWSLARWLGTLLFVVAAWALVRWWPNFWPAVGAGAVWVVFVLWLVWAHRSGYLHFVPLPDAAAVLDGAPLRPLRKEEKVPARASGWFTVEGADAYLVDLESDFETVGTREHIVLARLYRSRFLLLGRWPAYQIGWWYIFIMPAMIRELGVGRLHTGREPGLALRIVYAPHEETRQTIYLAFDDPHHLQRVWVDLVRDAPPGVALGGGKQHVA